MDSEEDSWLLPAAKPWWPEAQLCPAYTSKPRRNGYAVSVRLGLAASRTRVLTMAPQAESAAHAWSYWATIAAAYT